MPSSHLPRTLCDKFLYDFPCEFLGIVGGYGLRHLRSHYLRASCDFFYGASGATRGNSVQRLGGDCTEIVQCQCSCRAVSASSARKSYGVRAGIVQCHLLRATGYGLTIFSNLSNFSLSQNVEAAEPVNPYENLTAASCLRRKGEYGQDMGSVDPSQAKCELGINDKPDRCKYNCREEGLVDGSMDRNR